MSKKKSINPFYILLVLAGTAFAVTAMAFGVMTVRGLQATRMAGYVPEEEAYRYNDSTEFDQFMDRNGTRLLVAELILLAIGTVGAIGYDQHLDRQTEYESETTDHES